MILREAHRRAPVSLAAVLGLDHNIPHPPRGRVTRIVAANPEVTDSAIRLVNEIEHGILRGRGSTREGPIERLARVLIRGLRILARGDQIRRVLRVAALPPGGEALCVKRDESGRRVSSLTARGGNYS